MTEARSAYHLSRLSPPEKMTSVAHSQATAPISLPRRWLREPLLHFLVFGALLFAADRLLLDQRGDEATIVLTAGIDRELREIFSSANNREPSADELKVLRRRWFDNELLYREALSLELHRGDEGIRDRLVFKALSLVQADLKVEDATDAVLLAWFESHRALYDEPARLYFQEAVLRDAAMSDAEAFAERLNRDAAFDPGSAADLRVHQGRPLATLAPTWGAAFAEAMTTLPLNQWRALDSSAGARVVRIEQRTEVIPAAFDKVRGKVEQDWRDARAAELRVQAVRALEAKYKLVVAAEAAK